MFRLLERDLLGRWLSGRTARPVLLTRATISTAELDVVRRTLPVMSTAGEGLTRRFYDRLFAAHPELGHMFNHQNRKTGKQRRALFSSITACAESVLATGKLPLDMLESVHHKHCALGVVPDQYAMVGDHLFQTMGEILQEAQQEDGAAVVGAWRAFYDTIADQAVGREESLYKMSEAKDGGWRGERDFVVARKFAQSEDIVEFDLSPVDGDPVADYLPGQYTTVWLKAPDWEFRQARHYTLIPWNDEAPGQKPKDEDEEAVFAPGYSIAVKKTPDGYCSAFLHSSVQEGDVLPLSPPFGDFHIQHASNLWLADDEAPVVLLSGGIGITPALSMLGGLQGLRPVFWLHAAQNGAQHPFRDYLRGLSQAFADESAFVRRTWFEKPNAGDVRGAPNDNAAMFNFKGRMDLDDVREVLPIANAHAQYFFCGPKPWMESVAKQLVAFGVDPANLSFESFGPREDLNLTDDKQRPKAAS